MKLLYLIEILFFCVMTLSPACMNAQDRRFLTRAQIDSILNPTLLKDADKLVRFDKKVIDIGKITEDHQPIDVVFPFQHIGDKPLVIHRITTDCGCTVAQADKQSYGPGERGKITVKYTPKNHVGTIDASTKVFAAVSESHPVAKLVIVGEVLPGEDYWKGYHYAMGPLRLKRKQMHFSFSKKGGQTERILCANSGPVDLKLAVKELPEFIQFKTEPSIIKPGEEADMVVRVDLSKVSLTEVKSSYRLILEGLDMPEEKRTLRIEIDLNQIK